MLTQEEIIKLVKLGFDFTPSHDRGDKAIPGYWSNEDECLWEDDEGTIKKFLSNYCTHGIHLSKPCTNCGVIIHKLTRPSSSNPRRG
jgi:hypothetical protein